MTLETNTSETPVGERGEGRRGGRRGGGREGGGGGEGRERGGREEFNYVDHVCEVCSVKCLTIVHGFWPESENFDSGKKGYHQKVHLKRNRMAQF